jgi:ABC-type Fe3+/spermidine/putrescine transport system ATPase subunit
VLFGGQDVTGLPAHRRGFGLMFQDHALFPHLDTGKNVEFGLRMTGYDAARRKARARELMELVGLAGFERRSIEKLSGGERQRVALARTLAPAPKLLMLDEPLASLDRGLRERLVGELKAILGRVAVPALYVTHDQFEAFAIADRVSIMDRGRIVRTGPPREVWDEPRTEFVARFLGMDNIVRGTRQPGGMVETAFGDFGPIEGSSAEVTLLLRSEGAAIAREHGSNVASGTVTTSLFHGGETLVRIRAGEESLEFPLPPDGEYGVGAKLRVKVARVQALG